nr:CPPV212 hypothetical protein [Cooks petrelpox virus]
MLINDKIHVVCLLLNDIYQYRLDVVKITRI